MPHIIIEHSANIVDLIDLDALVQAVHETALRDGFAALEALRTRAVSRERYLIADQDPDYGFVAVTARIGPGRSDEEIKCFVTALADTVDQALAPLHDKNPVALSVEVQLIDPALRVNRNHIRDHLARRGRP